MHTPAEEAKSVLRRYMGFLRMGFSEMDAMALAASDVGFNAVRELLRKRCPKHLVARILT